MNESRSVTSTVARLAVGELVVSVLTVIVYALFSKLDYTVVTGVLLGSLIVIGNFWFQARSIDRTVSTIMEERGTAPMTDEEAAKFAEDHSAIVKQKMTLSFMIRMATMAGALIAAFLIPNAFTPLATLIPLLMFRPILSVGELFGRKEK